MSDMIKIAHDGMSKILACHAGLRFGMELAATARNAAGRNGLEHESSHYH